MHATFRTLATLSAFAASLALSACRDGATEPLPGPTPVAFDAGVYHLYEADGQELPTVVAHRLIDGEYETTMLDSVQLDVGTDKRWSQKTWMRTFRAGVLAAITTYNERGTVQSLDGQPHFVSEMTTNTFVARERSDTAFTTTQRLVQYAGAGLVVGRYSRMRS